MMLSALIMSLITRHIAILCSRVILLMVFMVAFLLKTMPKSCQILTTKIVQFFDIKVATFKKNVKLIGLLADRSVQQMKFPIRFIIGTILSKGTKKKEGRQYLLQIMSACSFELSQSRSPASLGRQL